MALTQINKAGLDEIALDHVFTIGASGSSAYTFQGEGLNGTVNNPTLYLTRGKTYRFENGSGGHPIRIQSTSGASGTAYNTGVTNNAGSGTVIVEVQHDAPDVLYYQCTSHAAMNGVLYITGALADGGVTTAKLADDAVTSAKIADDAVNSDQIANGSIDHVHLANDIIGAENIADGAVRTEHIQDGNVTTVKLASGAVTAAKISNGQITTDKIPNEAVTLAKLEHGTSSNDGKFLRANNGADPSFESIPAGITINNQADNRIITATGTTDTLNGESSLTYDNPTLEINTDTSPYGVLNLNGNSGGLIQFEDNEVTKWSLYGDSTFSIYDNVNSANRIRINSSGNVGIGTDTPVYKLHLNESTSGSNYITFTNSDTGTSGQDGAQVGIDGLERLILWQAENNDIRFATNNTERIRILSGGGLTFNGDTTQANALDDYEEGSWTPTAIGWSQTGTNSYGVQAGRYIKIGNLVTVFFHVEWTNLSNASGVLAISGFPYVHRTTNYYGSTAVQCRYLDYSGDTVFAVYGSGFGSSVLLYAQNDNGNHQYVPIDGAARVEGTISYLAG